MRYSLLAFSIITLTGCSKDGVSGDTGNCNPNGMFADIDGDGFGAAPLQFAGPGARGKSPSFCLAHSPRFLLG